MEAEVLVALCKQEPDELITLYGKQIHPYEILHYPENEQRVQADILLADLQCQVKNRLRERFHENDLRCPCGQHNLILDAQMTTVYEGHLWDVRCLRRALQ